MKFDESKLPNVASVLVPCIYCDGFGWRRDGESVPCKCHDCDGTGERCAKCLESPKDCEC